MKKLIIFAFLFAVVAITNLKAQEVTKQPKADYWGTFCLVSQTIGDTNFFKIDLTQLPSEFEKVYFKFYYMEQDVFHAQIKEYNIDKGLALVAVPKKYTVEDYRHFMADMRKMTQTANHNFSSEQKNEYILNHKDK